MLLEDKHADIKARRGDDDFFYAWCGEFHMSIYDKSKKYVSVEYIPSNWPALLVVIGTDTLDVEEQKKKLEGIGYEVEE